MNYKTAFFGVIITTWTFLKIYDLFTTLWRRKILGEKVLRIYRPKSDIFSSSIFSVIYLGLVAFGIFVEYRTINTFIRLGPNLTHDYSDYYLVLLSCIGIILEACCNLSSKNFIFNNGISYKCKTLVWKDIESYSWTDNSVTLNANKKFLSMEVILDLNKNEKEEIERLLINFIGKPVENSTPKRDA